MKTLITKFNDSRIFDYIKDNQVIAFPTETVYGLGVIYNSSQAFQNLVDTKHRRPDKPFTLMLGNKDDIEKYAIFSEKTKKIIEKFFPGELTILVKPKNDLYSWVTLNSKYIGIRVPNSKDVCDMINTLGQPMLVSSCNISDEPVCENFEEVYNKFNDKIAIIIEGEVISKTPSTIVICDDELTLVREGKISFSELKKVWEE